MTKICCNISIYPGCVRKREREMEERGRERERVRDGVSSLVEEKCGPPRFLPRHKNQLETKKCDQFCFFYNLEVMWWCNFILSFLTEKNVVGVRGWCNPVTNLMNKSCATPITVSRLTNNLKLIKNV